MKLYFIRQGHSVLITDHCPTTTVNRDFSLVHFTQRRSENDRPLRSIVLDASTLPPMKENIVYPINL